TTSPGRSADLRRSFATWSCAFVPATSWPPISTGSTATTSSKPRLPEDLRRLPGTAQHPYGELVEPGGSSFFQHEGSGSAPKPLPSRLLHPTPVGPLLPISDGMA